MKNLIYFLAFSLIIFGCKKETPFDINKQNELADFSEDVFNLKTINSKEILRLIELKTVTKFKDTAEYSRTPKATIYADNSAKTYFQVFEQPKNVITALSYYKNGKEIYVAEYYGNGTIMCKFNTSREGIRNGKYECYYENGETRTTGEYLKNKKIGIETEYDLEGNITYEFDYSRK